MDMLLKISVLQVNFNLLAGRFGTSNICKVLLGNRQFMVSERI